jgi:hypothetical protein
MSDEIKTVFVLATIFIGPFGIGFALAYWLAGREFRALLDQSTRTIELMEKWVDERNSAMTDTTKQGATVGGEGEMEIRWIGGNCPVQAEGTIDGKEFYFRARGDSWSMDIGGDDPVAGGEWSYEEDYGKGPYDAGWMTIEEARGFIAKAVAIYRAAAPNANERE